MQTVIRPFRDGDREAVTLLQNRDKPPHLWETVAEWERWDARRPETEILLRLCAADPDTDTAVAYLGVADRGTSAYRKEGVCSLGLWVDQDWRGRGLGGALYERAEAFALERGARQIQTHFRLFRPDEPALRFFGTRGFVEIDREVPALLDLTTFDPAPHVRPLPDGLRLLSLAEAGDTEESRRRVYALDGLIHPDLPTHDTLPEQPAFEQWNKMLQGPEYDPRAVILAETTDGAWVGLSVLGFQEHTNVGWTNITGVLREWRGRGVATALKLRAIQAARDRHCLLILTENHEDNAPMRAVNRRLGFVADAPGVAYHKEIADERR